MTFDKRISWGNLAAIIVFIFTAGGAYAMLSSHVYKEAHDGAEERLDILEERVAVVEVLEQGNDSTFSEFKVDLFGRLQRIEDKQDSLQEQLILHSQRKGE